MIAFRLSTIFLVIGLLAACGGGASGVAPPSLDNTRPTQFDLTPSGQNGVAAFTFFVTEQSASSGARAALYMSLNTQSFVVLTNGANPQTINVNRSSPACRTIDNGGSLSCAIAIRTPSGTCDFTITSYAQINGRGAELSTNSRGPIVIGPGRNTPIAITLEGSSPQPYSFCNDESAGPKSGFNPRHGRAQRCLGRDDRRGGTIQERDRNDVQRYGKRSAIEDGTPRSVRRRRHHGELQRREHGRHHVLCERRRARPRRRDKRDTRAGEDWSRKNLLTYNADGTPTTPAISVHSPSGLAVDAAGKIFVSRGGTAYDQGGGESTYNPDGTPTTSTLNGIIGGAGTTAIAMAGTTFYLGYWDYGTYYGLVQQYDAQSGNVVGFPITTANNSPAGIAVNASGTIYIACIAYLGEASVKTYNASGFEIDPTINFDLANAPNAVAVDAAGTIYVAGGGSSRITTYNPDGTPRPLTITAGLDSPDGIAIDAAGKLYPANAGNGTVSTYNADGRRPDHRTSQRAERSEHRRALAPASRRARNAHRSA
jgi:hypothetical protein